MANKLAIATGNFTTAGTWVTGNTGTNALLISTSTGTTALTTGNLDSATFVPAAQASQYLAIRLGSRASGSPSNKMTVKLRNSTAGTDSWTFVINVSDLPVCDTTADQGGWIVFKAAASLTPNGTDSYIVRITLDSTSTAVSICTNGTANNWQRQMFQTATGAPAAGDDMLIAGIWDTTNPAVKTNVAVTMDSTAATDYGSNTTTYRTAALNICNGGTLTWGTSASTNYILRLSGHRVGYSGGAYNQGTTGTPIPLSSTAKMQFDCGSDNAFGEINRSGFANSRVWAGYTVSWALLAADAAAAATSLTTNVSTGWKNGDVLGLASTTSDRTKGESKTLGADASGTSLPTVGALTNAHSGTSPTQCEVVNLTRGVTVETTTAANMTFVNYLGTATGTEKWVRFDGLGSTTSSAGLSLQGTGTVTVQYCVHVNGENRSVQFVGANNFTYDNNVLYNSITAAGSPAIYMNGAVLGGSSWSITNNVCIFTTGTVDPFWISDLSGTITGNRMVGGAQSGCIVVRDVTSAGQGTTGVFSDNVTHSGAVAGLAAIGTAVVGWTITNQTSWRNGTSGVRFEGSGTGASFDNISVVSPTIFGNVAQNVLLLNAIFGRISLSSFLIAGDSTSACPVGVDIGSSLGWACAVQDLALLNGTLGNATGIYVTHTTADVRLNPTSTGAVSASVRASNVLFGSATETSGFTVAGVGALLPSRLTSQGHDQIGAAGKTVCATGTVTYETSTVDVSPSIKLTPVSATLKLDTAGNVPGRGWLVPVDSGQTPTVSVKIQKDGSYNGNAPRLVLKANPALGVNSDTVLGTFSAGSGSWQTVAGACPTASADGVYEVVVDCDGTAGNAFADSLTVSGGSTRGPGGLPFWFDGLAAAMVSNVSGGSGPVGERSYVFGL